MSFKKHIIHTCILRFEAPNVAFHQSTKCCIIVSFLSAVVYQIGALTMAQCAPPSLEHVDVQAVIIGGLLHNYHMYHIEYSTVLHITELSSSGQ